VDGRFDFSPNGLEKCRLRRRFQAGECRHRRCRTDHGKLDEMFRFGTDPGEGGPPGDVHIGLPEREGGAARYLAGGGTANVMP